MAAHRYLFHLHVDEAGFREPFSDEPLGGAKLKVLSGQRGQIHRSFGFVSVGSAAEPSLPVRASLKKRPTLERSEVGTLAQTLEVKLTLMLMNCRARTHVCEGL